MASQWIGYQDTGGVSPCVTLNTFDETDRKYLEEICKMIRP